MAKLHKISLGSEIFLARSGQRVLDAALLNGVEMPHDCRAGRCGACLTRVKTGITLGGETRQAGMVHACQAMVFSDLALEVEPLPPVLRVSGTLSKLSELAEDIVEVTIEPSRRLDMLPGQYCRFRFRGFPARSFSPTSSLGALQSDGRIRLHVKRVRGGRVTPSLGNTICEGHQVHIEGPFGHAFLRPGLSNRLVLIGSGTGFAPVWAVGAAALRENPERQMTVIAASRRAAAFYMTPALALISRYPNVKAIATIEASAQVRPLSPTVSRRAALSTTSRRLQGMTSSTRLARLGLSMLSVRRPKQQARCSMPTPSRLRCHSNLAGSTVPRHGCEPGEPVAHIGPTRAAAQAAQIAECFAPSLPLATSQSGLNQRSAGPSYGSRVTSQC